MFNSVLFSGARDQFGSEFSGFSDTTPCLGGRAGGGGIAKPFYLYRTKKTQKGCEYTLMPPVGFEM
jgi:hypothetical protein